jgi:ABC-type spermidine/putrescine transport system permease subunit I
MMANILSRGTRAGVLLTVPAAALLIAFFVVPLVQLLGLSFSGAGLENYAEIFTSSGYQRSLLVSARVAILVAMIDLLLAYPLAYYLTITTRRGRAIGLFIVLLPFWSSQLIRAFAWLVIFGRYGIVNGALMNVGVITEPIQLLYTEVAVLVGSAYVMLPFMVFPLYSAMRGIDPGLVPAARGLGASGFQAFVNVYLPLSMNGLLAGVILVFVLTLGSYTNAAVLGGGKVIMIALAIRQQVSILLDLPMAGALSVVLLVVTIVCYALISRSLRTAT